MIVASLQIHLAINTKFLELSAAPFVRTIESSRLPPQGSKQVLYELNKGKY